ncbi:twin-arginine translocation signal domain-containing protein [Methylophaga sp. OBS3]|uniref:twin-arginine translocation signal domain-containing protein n=1 Tax=Methylophaga sp. OBS3 TaxID=2991934 RepID=UPI00225B6B92|nr:twin-arginine translocation signal domain-containing protein [Methylophaga sp. OBS3]MCX4190620.1 twin-arginine translocation signal domain-containing protein [Methylophaga sp. OBS3]
MASVAKMLLSDPEITMSSQSSSSRRKFLHTLTALAGGSAAVALSSKAVHAQPTPAPEKTAVKPQSSKGYQHTEHVDTFYKTADF